MLPCLDKCCGCLACLNRCPACAIEVVEDQFGFACPRIDSGRCINCGLCETVCPIINPPAKNEEAETVYAAWNVDDFQCASSSSGGLFIAMAQAVIDDGGVVYGAVLEELTGLKHCRAEDMSSAMRMMGSKYFQSDISEVYSQAKEDINNGRLVLFTGTPCQIAGLKAFLGKTDSGNLVTVEILCHGVPSRKVVEAYISSVEKKTKKKIISMRFRWKDGNHSWRVSCCCRFEFEDGSFLIEESLPPNSAFWIGFLNNLFLRESCYTCQYTTPERVSDLTIGDYWGAWDDKTVAHREKLGVSLLVINNDIGDEFIKRTLDRITIIPTSKQNAYQNNLTFEKPFCKNPNRRRFFSLLDNTDFEKNVRLCLQSYYLKQDIKKMFGERTVSALKRIVRKVRD